MNLKNAKILSKKEQKSINGGGFWPTTQYECELAPLFHWACVGSHNCGCLYDGPVDPPIK